ncbi:hypothetical protein BLNAU_19458 [Blattamonas nauphoetae]|uniref:Nucleoplasmin-like domain-containing protein n=1 Tax=Blattamonas nauphoetae TaxID=2049346 RepID=A0ABQ9X1X6_9EUKA|nr:hypothetical protein BLNAU_19458 [Blattamonas nauphoetae]
MTFFSCYVDANNPFTRIIGPNIVLHLTSACITPNSTKTASLVISNGVLSLPACHLDPKNHTQQSLHYIFSEGKKVLLTATGQGKICVVGYQEIISNDSEDAERMMQQYLWNMSNFDDDSSFDTEDDEEEEEELDNLDALLAFGSSSEEDEVDGTGDSSENDEEDDEDVRSRPIEKQKRQHSTETKTNKKIKKGNSPHKLVRQQTREVYPEKLDKHASHKSGHKTGSKSQKKHK